MLQSDLGGTVMSNHWLWITVPVGLISLVVLSIFVWRLIEAHRAEMVLSVPLLAEQEFSIDFAGAFLLHAEGPRATRAFGGLDYQLLDLSDQSVVPLKSMLVPHSSSGISRARLSLRSFETGQAGTFLLTVTGLTDPAVAQEHNLVVTHDRRAGKIGNILAVVFSGIGFIASTVLSLLVFLFNR